MFRQQHRDWRGAWRQTFSKPIENYSFITRDANYFYDQSIHVSLFRTTVSKEQKMILVPEGFQVKCKRNLSRIVREMWGHVWDIVCQCGVRKYVSRACQVAWCAHQIQFWYFTKTCYCKELIRTISQGTRISLWLNGMSPLVTCHLYRTLPVTLMNR